MDKCDKCGRGPGPTFPEVVDLMEKVQSMDRIDNVLLLLAIGGWVVAAIELIVWG